MPAVFEAEAAVTPPVDLALVAGFLAAGFCAFLPLAISFTPFQGVRADESRAGTSSAAILALWGLPSKVVNDMLGYGSINIPNRGIIR